MRARYINPYTGFGFKKLFDEEGEKIGMEKEENKRQKALESKIAKLKKEAEEQLKEDTVDERFKKTIGKTVLIKLILIYSGSEPEYTSAVPHDGNHYLRDATSSSSDLFSIQENMNKSCPNEEIEEFTLQGEKRGISCPINIFMRWI